MLGLMVSECRTFSFSWCNCIFYS